jgi:alkane 1-monooxygenase
MGPDRRDPAGRQSRALPTWRDPKRYLWLLGAVIPALVFGSWIAVHTTGSRVFWWLGPIVAFVVIPLLDRVVGTDSDNPPDQVLASLEDDRFYRLVTYLYLPGQYLSLAFACWLWSGGGWLTMTVVDKLGLMAAVGITGGVAISAAHELGHRRAPLERRMSKIALAQTWYGHFFVEHNRGHHARVATAEDPASSRLGESLYRFIPRSVVGGVRSAWQLERARLKRMSHSPWSLRNDVLNSWLLSAILFTCLMAWFGSIVLPFLIGQALIGFCMLETVNYLEHYGLRRQKDADGRYERVRPSHSWNSNTVVANVFLFHLQRHSDHHAHPIRRYQALRHSEEAPQLPSGYATMMVLALIPAWWHRVMDWRVVAHYDGDVSLAALRPGYELRPTRATALSPAEAGRCP